MKLRIKGNSLRLRLTKTEVENFERDGKIREKVEFGGGQTDFCYGLEQTSAAQVSAVFENGKITVFVPRRLAGEWANNEEVGFEATQKIDEQGNILQILVEKDFVCLTPRTGEDESDNYPHPSENENC